MEKDFIRNLLAGQEGFNFQDACERYLIIKHGKDFIPITPNGREGDGGRDGYCLSTGEYFAMSSREDVHKKIREDFANCMSYEHPVSIFTFITNRGIRPKDSLVLDELKRDNPGIEIGIVRHSEIAVEMTDMSTEYIEYILGQPLPYRRGNTVYFRISKFVGPFTLSRSLIDSLHFYILLAVSCSLLGACFYYFSSEWERSLSFTALIGLMFTYMYYNKNSLKQYKYAHKILYLLLTDKLRVGNEVLLNEDSHITICRNAVWKFTINERSAKCLRTGCSGHVLLYKSPAGTFIGRCNKDKINHTYNVDNNFYGNMN
ncbi:hypothetical protein EG359_05735 [Chryseobacterium joostei]|uniref:Restriction endonuclease n=1 Tax=Chryseobacterium joostei TaxID=112234 RepID=A0A1N7HTT0_9FLAO|nr:hypothetical protein [Chryseobacterium joostei]AZA99133.1 hypothetical protein EG359_05735 [Chryseobacterium joostei]SIS28233.1 hypothetical protein SAMN05421768_101214 [Chryseobacterium joostei]